jgi:hypothetical protein
MKICSLSSALFKDINLNMCVPSVYTARNGAEVKM